MSFTRIYVGNLPQDVRESELDDLFYKVRAAVVGRGGGENTVRGAAPA